MGRGNSTNSGNQSTARARQEEELFNTGIASLAALKHPEHCEDSALVMPEHQLLAVFDGIGGAAGGERASQAAKSALENAALALTNSTAISFRKPWLQESILQAAAAVRAARSSSDQGTTATIAIVAEDHLLYVSIGDSRCYLYRDHLRLLSRDDDILDASPESDAARAEVDQAQSLRDIRSQRARRLFSSRNRLSDELGMTHSPPSIEGQAVQAKDIIIITSDGVHDNLTEEEISTIIVNERENGAQAISQELCRRSRARSLEDAHLRAKDDDITAVVLVLK